MENIKEKHSFSYYYTGHRFTSSDSVCCFITWTDWDFGSQLRAELKRKKINYPEYLKSWVDLRSVARKKLPKFNHIPRLRKIFDIVEIEWTGNQHMGITDARNTGFGSLFRFRPY